MMKKYTALLFAGIMILGLACTTTASREVTIELTNPHDTVVVAFDGYYQVNAGAEEPMTGETPAEYIFELEEGDQVDGMVYKSDTTNLTDTLHFQVLFDGVEQPIHTKDIIQPSDVIAFTISVQ
jgi:hypothetical protein